MSEPYARRIRSPDGRFEIAISEREAFNSHWVFTPTLIDTRNSATLLALDSRWSLDHSSWLSETRVKLTLRKYPGNHVPPDLTLTIDCVARTARMGEADFSLAEAEAQLDRSLAFTR